MKKIILSIIFILICFNLYSQEVEKIGEIEEIKYVLGVAGGSDSPISINVDEVNELVEIPNEEQNKNFFYRIDKNLIKVEGKEDIFTSWYTYFIRLGEYKVEVYDNLVAISEGERSIYYDFLNSPNKSGISFILKKDEGYIVYYVDEIGIPGAVDTEGRIYSKQEAVEYLKEYDPKKYAKSLARAEELGLKAAFERGSVLIWGQTYYATNNGLEKVFGEPIYGHPELVQYDNQGYGYQLYLSNFYSYVQIVSSENKTIHMDYDINRYTNIFLSNEDNIPFSASWYVGYGGNIYYYIAGEEYTEVFRIRRTWGNPDMYAMAINGYTEDSYGEYVEETLGKMSKAELRLLRNTIFALYGVHFKSEDLSKHFAKEVWYTDEGKTSGEVELPAHRQKLVEMIQELERK